MKLRQGQVWKRDTDCLRIVHLERLAVDYKILKFPEAREGTHQRATKKEFCRLLKGAVLFSLEEKI